jgi:hypothetical protein
MGDYIYAMSDYVVSVHLIDGFSFIFVADYTTNIAGGFYLASFDTGGEDFSVQTQMFRPHTLLVFNPSPQKPGYAWTWFTVNFNGVESAFTFAHTRLGAENTTIYGRWVENLP